MTLFHFHMGYPCPPPLAYLQPPTPTEGNLALSTSIYLLNYTIIIFLGGSFRLCRLYRKYI